MASTLMPSYDLESVGNGADNTRLWPVQYTYIHDKD
jgi:hypothetical protein